MPAGITKHNWPAQILVTLDAILRAAESYPSGSIEATALLCQAAELHRMCELVRERAPGKREGLSSPLIASVTHDGLSLPEDILKKVGAIYTVYRLWRHELVWDSQRAKSENASR